MKKSKKAPEIFNTFNRFNRYDFGLYEFVFFIWRPSLKYTVIVYWGVR